MTQPSISQTFPEGLPAVSVPAADLNEKRLQAQRFGRIARYQVHNTLLLLVAAAALFGWIKTAQALRANADALKHFRPIVVRENELGQTLLVTHQSLNFSHDERAVRSTLQFWATFHLGRMRATVQDFYTQSFLWMDETYGASIRNEDQKTEWLRKFLNDAGQDQYKVVVKNVVLTTVETSDGVPQSGKADIYAFRQYYSPDGTQEPHKPSDDFLVKVNWAAASDVPNDVQGVNPLGIAVTNYQIFNSLE